MPRRLSSRLLSGLTDPKGVNMTNQIQVEGKRTVPTYTTLRAVSWYANELAKPNVPGRLNHIITSMLFDAFTLEAYLNHLGSKQLSFWPPLKEKLGPKEKLDVLCEVLEFHPDFGQSPWQSWGFIFKLRNLLVHAQTESVPFRGELHGEELHIKDWPKAKWEEYISVKKCQNFLDDTKSMIIELATKAGISPDDVFEKDSLDASVITSDDLEGIKEQSG
jgi:hypothetical protein